MSKLALRILKVVLPLALGVYLIFVFFNGMSPQSLEHFYRAMAQANYFWIILALVLTFAAYASRAYRWKYTLEPLGYQTTFWNRYHSMMIGYLINLTIPRAGEASRSAMLLRSEKVPFSKSFGTIIAERAVDVLMLGSIVLVTLYTTGKHTLAIANKIKQRFGPDPDKTSALSDVFFYGLLVLIFALIVALILKSSWRKAVFRFFREVLAGVLSIFKATRPLAYIAHTLLIWTLYIVFFWVAFFSLEATTSMSMEAVFLAFLAGSIGIVFTNGGIGMFPLLVGIVVEYFLGDSNPDALAIGNALGMLIWISQTILLITLGLISLWVITSRNPKKDVETELHPTENQES